MHSRRLIYQVVLTASAIALGGLSLRSTAVALLPPTMLVENRLIGDNPALVMSVVGNTITTKPSAALTSHVRRAAAMRPLDEAPFELAAAEAMAKGDEARAQRIVATALDREPRQWRQRLLLLQSYVQRGEVDKSTRELIVLSRLVPENNELFVATVAQMVVDPASRPLVMTALSRSPLTDRVLDYLARTHADPAIVTSLARSRGIPFSAKDADWQARLVADQVAARQYASAYSLWREFLPPGDRRFGLIFNPRFFPSTAARPFNWQFADGSEDVGVAEPTRTGELDTLFYGRTSGALASQLLMLRPNDYTFSYSVDGVRTESAPDLAWTIDCATDDRSIARFALPSAPEKSAIAFRFTVPRGCSAQWLRLAGTAGEISRTRAVVVSDLALRSSAETTN